MRITPDSIPMHVARAYGLRAAPANVPSAPQRTPATDATHRDDLVDVRSAPNADGKTDLVAAQVTRPVDFAAPAPAAQSAQAIPFYRHPADRNAAATSIEAGRVLDVSG